MAALGQAFGLERPPRRVEVYDNSHIMGANAVGAMIVAGPNGFMKPHYRTFTIKSEDLTPGDDYGMMREVLRRRFAPADEGGAASRRTPACESRPAEDAGGRSATGPCAAGDGA